MKILFDHLGFMEKYGGVSRYYSSMISNLDSDIDYEIALKFSSNEYVSTLKTGKITPQVKKNFKHKERFYSELNKPYSKYLLKKGDYDVYHNTHVDPYGFKYVPSDKKKIITIYDLNLQIIPGICRENFSLKVWQKESVKLVDKIITISENTKKDIIEQWNISPDNIKVIYLGKPEIDLNIIKEIKPVDEDYILYVGQRSSFKNFNLLVKAFSNISLKYPELKLVCTGAPFNQNELDFISSLNLSDKIIHFSASDKQLFGLYNHAKCFVYPSLYEGFGMPLLESMVCECPVICSRASCFPEIAADAAEYFDPYSQTELETSLDKVLSDQDYKSILIKNGLENVKRFSWEKCGKEHSDFYKSL